MRNWIWIPALSRNRNRNPLARQQLPQNANMLNVRRGQGNMTGGTVGVELANEQDSSRSTSRFRSWSSSRRRRSKAQPTPYENKQGFPELACTLGNVAGPLGPSPVPIKRSTARSSFEDLGFRLTLSYLECVLFYTFMVLLFFKKFI